MTLKDNKQLNLIDFSYILNHKLSGVSFKEEKNELDYEGYILKLFEPTYPKTIGYFELTVYNLDKSREFDEEEGLLELIKELSEGFSYRYENIYNLIDDFKDKNRIIFLKNCVIHPDWCGKGIFKELLKSIYLTHFIDSSVFILNASPIQNDIDFTNEYFDEFPISVADGKGVIENALLGDYFQLERLPSVDEMNEYKLYNKMLNHNLKQYERTNYFYQDDKNSFLKLFNN